MSETKAQDRFTPASRTTIAAAKQWVTKFKHTHITPEHILLGLLQEKDSQVVTGLSTAKASVNQIQDLIMNHLRDGAQVVPDHLLTFSERAKRVIETAKEEAVRAKAPQIGPEHILLGLTRVPNTVCGAVLRAVDCHTDSVRAALNAQPAS